MRVQTERLHHLQELVIDITKIQRNHTFPGTERHENVVEHCFSIALLCWKLFDELEPDLDLQRILKYSLAHDFLERGLDKDVSTYASPADRQSKQHREEAVLAELSEEFSSFPDLTQTIHDYEELKDDEARFVKVVDKMQAIVLGEIDDWRPYRRIAVTYDEFYAKGDEITKYCPDCLRETLSALNAHSRSTFYDQPTETK